MTKPEKVRLFSLFSAIIVIVGSLMISVTKQEPMWFIIGYPVGTIIAGITHHYIKKHHKQEHP